MAFLANLLRTAHCSSRVPRWCLVTIVLLLAGTSHAAETTAAAAAPVHDKHNPFLFPTAVVEIEAVIEKRAGRQVAEDAMTPACAWTLLDLADNNTAVMRGSVEHSEDTAETIDGESSASNSSLVAARHLAQGSYVLHTLCKSRVKTDDNEESPHVTMHVRIGERVVHGTLTEISEEQALSFATSPTGEHFALHRWKAALVVFPRDCQDQNLRSEKVVKPATMPFLRRRRQREGGQP